MKSVKYGLGLLAAVLLTGCATTVNNNYRTPQEFADHLVAHGVAVTQVQPLSPQPFRASEAVAVEVDGSDIGVYKYNRDIDIQNKRIERIAESGRTYVSGMPLPAVVHGSFMFLGLEKNKHKKAIQKAIESFN